MKKIVAVSIILFFGGIAVAQDEEGSAVSPTVVEAFKCLYPTITNVTWDFEDVNYSASFKLEGKAVSLLFDEYGNVIKVKNEIKFFELPPDVNQLISREYSGWTLGKASHIDSSGTDYYETVVQNNDQTMVLVFNRDGGLLVKVML